MVTLMRTRHRPASAARAAACRLGGPLALAAALVAALAGQGAAPPLQLLARDVRRTLPTTVVDGIEYVALDDLAPPFALNVREEGGSLTVTAGTRTIVLTPDQPLVSVAGRLVPLAAPPRRTNRRWLVPLDFVSRALGPATGIAIDLRKASRLLVVGDLLVPRVVVRQDGSPAQARITVDITPTAPATVTLEPGRLLVRIAADAIDPALSPAAPGPLVEAIQRVASEPVVAIQLGSHFGSYRASTAAAGNGSRVTLDLLAQGSPAAPPPAPPVQSATPLPPEPALAAGGLHAIAIDAGHGGDDAGARGAAGTIEKELTLDLARRLKSALEIRLGIRVVLTREDDRALGLDERAAIANNSRADLFLSLHANASVQPAARGATVFHLDAGRATGAATDTTPAGVPVLGGTRNIDLVLWDTAQILYLAPSARLAATVADSLRGRVELGAAPVREAPLRVLIGAHLPAVLVETGYLSNADDEKRLATDEYRNAFVQGLVEAVVHVRDGTSPAATVPPATPGGPPPGGSHP